MKRQSKSRIHPSRRGSTIVEFSFIFVVFLMTVVALMELGRGVWTYATLSHAARRGARFAMIHGSNNPVMDNSDNDTTDTEIANVVKAAAIGLDTSTIVVATPTWTPDRSRGSTVELTVTYNFNVVVGPPLLPRNTIPLTSTARMIVAN